MRDSNRAHPFVRKLLRLGSLAADVPSTAVRLGSRYLGAPRPPELYYVVPEANWVVDWIGHYITSGISSRFGWSTHVTATPHLLVDHVIHYGEVGGFLGSLGSRRNGLNTIVATIFHGSRATEFSHLAANTERFIAHINLPARIVTSCRIMERRVIEWGAAPDRVCCVPLGVDLSLFKPASVAERADMRRQLEIPEDAFCIGSFQKDGVGWEEGLEPKLEKGPDQFLDVVAKLHKKHQIIVLLTGPARGYVKSGLDSIGAPYRHVLLSDYREIVDYYNSLDVYVISSREEGGPLAVLESMATGVPLVSTRVGLAPDVVRHGENGLLADVNDVDSLAEHVARLIEDLQLRADLRAAGLETVTAYDWPKIAARYYHEVYSPLRQTRNQE